jgi:hypothetical protein
MNTFKRTFQDLQFDAKVKSFGLFIQKLCSIELLKFSSLMRYNSKLAFFKPNKNRRFRSFFLVVLIPFIKIQILLSIDFT